MNEFLRQAGLIFVGFSSGVVVSGGVFSFIAALGVVERMAEKTSTVSHIKVYEEAVMFGGIFGCLSFFVDYRLNLGLFAAVVFCLCVGVFVGTLAVSLAEVLDVVPIFMRRTRLKTGIAIFITALAIGKMVGSLVYFFVPGFL